MNTKLDQTKRIVIKIGSALLVDSTTGQLRQEWLERVADDIAHLRRKGKDILIVSSGSIALGRHILGLAPGRKLEENQAAAAVGQIHLAHAYQTFLAKRGLTAAQILLTYGDTEERRRYLNARSTLKALLDLGAVPLINENDTVATDEVRFGDNDRLAARVAAMTGADCLFLLSDIDGLYTENPKINKNAEFIHEVENITPEIEAMAGDPIATDFGRGGMVTKIAAGKIATASGCNMVILNGTRQNPLSRYETEGHGTWFHAATAPMNAWKSWIQGTLQPAGSVTIDQGAVKALLKGKSLLPTGVIRINGVFKRGDTVSITDPHGHVIGRGLVAYDSDAAHKIAGKHSAEIEEILGYSGREVMIHRSDLALDDITQI